MRKYKALVLAMSTVFALPGCEVMRDVDYHNEQVLNQTEEGIQYLPRQDVGLIKSPGYYLGDGKVMARKPGSLARQIGSPGMHAAEPQDIAQFARALSEQAHVQIKIDGDIYAPRGGGGGGGSSIAIRDSTGNDPVEMARAGSGAKQDLPLLRYDIAAGETVEDALNRVVSMHGFGWRYSAKADAIIIFRYETAVLELPMPSTKRDVSMKVDSGDLKADLESKLDQIDSMFKAIEGLLTEQGTVKLTDSGSVIVSDIPSSVSAIRDFVNSEEKKLKRQVLLQVRLFTFDETRSTGYELDWDAVYNNDRRIINLGQDLPESTLIGGLTSTITVVEPTSRFRGSQAAIDALARDTGASVAYENNFLTLSGSTVSASETRKTAYLKSVSGQGAGLSTELVTTTLEPGEIDTGLSMYLHPMISGDDVILDLGFTHESLISLTSEESGQNRITTPETAGRNTTQTVRLGNGGAVALTGFYVSAADTDEVGTGISSFKLMGGSSSNKAEQRRAVLVITASIVE